MNTLCYCCLNGLVVGLFSLSTSAAIACVNHPLLLPQAGTRVLTVAQAMVKSEAQAPQTYLPSPIKQGIFQDISQRTRDSSQALRVTQAQEQTWPDGCLGLAAPDLLCTMALVQGWQVVVTNGQQDWTYRTDAFGDLIKLESSTAPTP